MLRDRDFYLPKEARMQQLIIDVDRHFDIWDLPRVPGKRVGQCFVVSDYLSKRAFSIGLDMRVIAGHKIHRALGGKPENSFLHYFNFSPDNSRLVDLTFCQFVGEEGRLSQIRNGATLISGSLDSFPGVEGLMTDGTMPLNDESLRQYLKATSCAPDKSYIESATVEIFRERFI